MQSQQMFNMQTMNQKLKVFKNKTQEKIPKSEFLHE